VIAGGTSGPYRPGSLKDLLGRGRAILNGWMSLSDPFVAELLAVGGFASLTVDRQHGRPGPAGLWELALAITARGAAPLVRTSNLDGALIATALDAGFDGVICPMIETRDQAERLVEYCRYPPAGVRSFGPTRAVLDFDGDFRERSNDGVLCVAMIETRRALENLDEILAVPGLDGVYVGPADLALSLGSSPILDDPSDTTIGLLGDIVSSAREAKKFAGVHCASVEYGLQMVDRGFQFITVGSDVRLIRSMTETVVGQWNAAEGRSG